MPTKSKILFSLYQRLKVSPCSIPQLRLWKQANSYDISDRTLYRYLHELDIVVAEKFGEMLEITQTNTKRKYWKISPLTGSVTGIQSPDIPEQQSLQVPIQYSFGQAIINRETSGTREMIVSAIEAGAQLNMESGVTAAYEEVFPFDIVLPLKIIRHQCVDYVCFYHERNRKIQTAPIISLGRVSFEGGHFSPEAYQHKLKDFFNDHFGIFVTFLNNHDLVVLADFIRLVFVLVFGFLCCHRGKKQYGQGGNSTCSKEIIFHR